MNIEHLLKEAVRSWLVGDIPVLVLDDDAFFDASSQTDFKIPCVSYQPESECIAIFIPVQWSKDMSRRIIDAIVYHEVGHFMLGHLGKFCFTYEEMEADKYAAQRTSKQDILDALVETKKYLVPIMADWTSQEKNYCLTDLDSRIEGLKS